jgi:hypothetical protein
VVDIPVHRREKRGAKTTSPSTLLPRVFDDFVGMGARFAIVTCLVMLVERVCSPEHAVAVWARVLFVSLMKLVFMPFPVEFPLELSVTAKLSVSSWNA